MEASLFSTENTFYSDMYILIHVHLLKIEKPLNSVGLYEDFNFMSQQMSNCGLITLPSYEVGLSVKPHLD